MKLLYLVAVLVAALLSHCAVIQSPPSLDLIVRAAPPEVDAGVSFVNGTRFNDLSERINWTQCFVCLSGNYWSLKLIEYVSELPSYIVLTNTAAAIKAYERCAQMQNICDIYAWNEWVINYFPIPVGLPPGWR